MYKQCLYSQIVAKECQVVWGKVLGCQLLLQAEVLNEGEADKRRGKSINLLARTVPNMLHTLRSGAILVGKVAKEN